MKASRPGGPNNFLDASGITNAAKSYQERSLLQYASISDSHHPPS